MCCFRKTIRTFLLLLWWVTQIKGREKEVEFHLLGLSVPESEALQSILKCQLHRDGHYGSVGTSCVTC